jgi:hypothetical protein
MNYEAVWTTQFQAHYNKYTATASDECTIPDHCLQSAVTLMSLNQIILGLIDSVFQVHLTNQIDARVLWTQCKSLKIMHYKNLIVFL